MRNKALVLFSGGQDSSTCLAWTLANFAQVDTIGFGYGQRHDVEMLAREEILAIYKQRYPNLRADHILATDILAQIGGSSLLDKSVIEKLDNGLPSSFVPGRNLFFLTCAAALAYRLGISDIVAGVCETDFSGYPDCRDNAIKACNVAISLCIGREFAIHTPLMWLSKGQTWKLAEELGGPDLVEIIRSKSHTCYEGDHETSHPWGYGCGKCPACILRAKGWSEYLSGV